MPFGSEFPNKKFNKSDEEVQHVVGDSVCSMIVKEMHRGIIDGSICLQEASAYSDKCGIENS